MPILPLPQFEADLEADRKDAEAYAKLKTPKTLVVRFGVMKLVGEFPYSGDAKPGCGSKIVVRTHRGTEMGEMLTSTCPNSGCSKSVSRKEMLDYIENSGGKDYPFFTDGRALRVATIEDMNTQSQIESQKTRMVKEVQVIVSDMGFPIKVVDAEPLLGNERLTFYFASEDRVDFRDLVQVLSRKYGTRIELRQVGARDEARLIADYEKCGQHCCCKQFLKVLKPISIKAAKTQKATLDPLKISGRCGRLMCCLRYEDETYEALSAKLPKMKKRVGTPHGVGIVVDRQVLTQLVRVRLEHDMTEIAVTVEELCPPEEAPQPPQAAGPGQGAPGGGPGGPGGPGGRDRPPMRRGPEGRSGSGPNDAPPRQPAREADPLRGLTPEQVEQKLNRGRQQEGDGAGQPAAGGGVSDGGRRGAPSRDRQSDFRERSGQARGEPRASGQGQPPAERRGPGSSERGPSDRGNAPGGRGPKPPAPQRGAAIPPGQGEPNGGPPSEHDLGDEEFDGPDEPVNQGESQGIPGQPGGEGPAKRRRRRRRRGGRGGSGGGGSGGGGSGGGGSGGGGSGGGGAGGSGGGGPSGGDQGGGGGPA